MMKVEKLPKEKLYLILEKLDKLHFYTKKPPKSLGVEWVREFVLKFWIIIQIETNDLLHTYPCILLNR